MVVQVRVHLAIDLQVFANCLGLEFSLDEGLGQVFGGYYLFVYCQKELVPNLEYMRFDYDLIII